MPRSRKPTVFDQPEAARSHAGRGQQLRANGAGPCAGGLNQSPSPPRLLRVGPPESESARQVLTRNRRGISPAASRCQCRRKLGSMGVQPGVGGDGGGRLGDKTWRSLALQAHRRQWPEISDFVARFCTLRESKHTRTCEKRVQFSHFRLFSGSRNVQKSDKNHIPLATA